MKPVIWLFYIPLTALFLTATIVFIWAGWIDTQPPINSMIGKPVSYHWDTHNVEIEWHGRRTPGRNCEGTRSAWIRDGIWRFLQTETLPPVVFRRPPPPDGMVTWHSLFYVEPELEKLHGEKLELLVQLNFDCNALQGKILSPVVINAPPIDFVIDQLLANSLPPS